jgi:hypothetical protein
VTLYEKLAVPDPAQDTPYTWRFIDLNSAEVRLHDRALSVLDKARLMFATLTPDKLIALTMLSQERFLETDRIVSGFFAYLNFTRLTGTDAIADAIARGVSDGKLGYTAVWTVENGKVVLPSKELIYFGRTLRRDEIDLTGSLLIDAESARDLTAVAHSAIDEVDSSVDRYVVPNAANPQMASPSSASEEPPSTGKRRFRLSVRTDKSRVFKAFKAIQTLSDKADRMTVQIEVIAETDGAFDPVWLRNAIAEPLDEADIDAQSSLE